MGLFFDKKAATEKNYKQLEKDLYVQLATLKKMCEQGESEGQYYVINAMDNYYKKPFETSFRLTRFYTKHRTESKEFMFKQNFLLSKTRGLFSAHKKKETKLSEVYLVKKELVNRIPEEYYRMFKIERMEVENNE